MTRTIAEAALPAVSLVAAAGRTSSRVRLLRSQTLGQTLEGTRLRPAQQPVVRVTDTGGTELLVGLDGAREPDVEQVRASVQAAVGLLDRPDAVAVDLADVAGLAEPSRLVSGAVGGVLDGCSRHGRRGWPRHVEVTGLPASDSAAADTAQRAVHQACAAELARELVDAAPSALPPEAFAELARTVGSEAGLRVEVWDAAELRRQRCGGVLAVGAGSSHAPCLIRLEYTPDVAAADHVVLVGKGVTFDSGGLSLKSADALMDMKRDMAGAAAILGAMSVLGALDVSRRVTALLPLAENLPGPGATRIGDVVRTRSGLSVEVLNSDFEGRVLLSDALTLAGELAPDAIVDLATLTESAVRALGAEVAALFATDDELAAALTGSGVAVGEPLWRLPLLDRYAVQLRSRVADLRNFPGSPDARAITAALFLREFVPADVPWAHIDLAGPASRGTPGESSATGFGARLLCDFLSAPSQLTDRPSTPHRKGSRR